MKEGDKFLQQINQRCDRVEKLWQFIEILLTTKPYGVVATVNQQN